MGHIFLELSDLKFYYASVHLGSVIFTYFLSEDKVHVFHNNL